jgi:hypothetical protein
MPLIRIYDTVLSHICTFACASLCMALQPFGPWSLFQFLNPMHCRYVSMDGGSALRKAVPTHRKTQTQNTHTNIHYTSGI